MITYSNILVTTTNSIEGIAVAKYIKPVTAHIVAGTNFFSDLFAGFTDIFGGRSKTYQRQLSTIYQEAIDALKVSAFEVGANAILGLKVDLDEISGKGKSMFMITAVGTAVVLRGSESSEEALQNISLDSIQVLRNKKELLDKANNGVLKIDDVNWAFITSNAISEVARSVFLVATQRMQDLQRDSSYDEHIRVLSSHLTEYFESIPEDNSLEVLYGVYLDSNLKMFHPTAYSLVVHLKICNVAKLINYLKSDDEFVKHQALNLATLEKAYYSEEDLRQFAELKKVVSSVFKKTSSPYTKTVKKLLSSKEVESWLCGNCGCNNDLEYKFCSGCNRDQYGFDSNEKGVEESLQIIDEILDLLGYATGKTSELVPGMNNIQS